MLKFKNNILSAEAHTIESPDYILNLQTDIPDCNYFGLLTLSNKVTKTLQFTKVNNIFKARLNLAEEDLNFLNNSSFKLVSISADFTKESNIVNLTFDINKIKLFVNQKTSKEIAEFRLQLEKLQEKLEALSLGKLVPNVNIANKDYIKPGMTLVALDNGNFMAAYPFADIIKVVNGQQAVDGVVEIDASMIKYNTGRTVEDQLKVLAEAITNVNSTIRTLTGEVKALSERLATLSMKVETHLDNGII